MFHLPKFTLIVLTDNVKRSNDFKSFTCFEKQKETKKEGRKKERQKRENRRPQKTS